MELTYEIILNKLAPKKQIVKEFKNFEHILDSSFTKYNINKDNSFWESLYFCLNTNNSYDIENFITDTKLEIIQKIEETYDDFFINFRKNYKKDDLLKLINDNDFTMTSYFICQVFKINLIFFDSNIQCSYFGKSFNPIRNTILLNKKNNIVEPIISNKKKMFNHNDKIINQILLENIDLIGSDIFSRVFEKSTTDDIYTMESSVINNENEIFTSYEDTNNEDTNNEDLNKLTKSKLNQILEKEYKIKVKNVAKVKKQELINMILNNKV